MITSLPSAIADKPALKESFTSTGSKLAWHQDVLKSMREDKRGKPVVVHLLIDDRCQDSCSFCSVLTREGNQLPFGIIQGILDQLVPLGLKSVILSGAGNPILYRCKLTGRDFNDVVNEIHGRGLQIGLITNGMPLKQYPCGRTSWKTVSPETLDKLTWVRISMSGLDHERKVVQVPDIDKSRTTLGFSWIMADIIKAPHELNHGKVSTLRDFHRYEGLDAIPEIESVDDRMPWIEDQIREYVEKYDPKYVRLLSNCLEPEKIDQRHVALSEMGARIDKNRVFSQWKPPAQPRVCYKGYPHPVVNSDGWVFSCDSVVLNTKDNADADHRFNNKWRVCRWDELTKLYADPIRPLVPNDICSGCVFNQQVDELGDIVDGFMDTPPMPETEPEHSAFI